MSTDHHRTISSASAYDDHDEMAAMELRPLVNNNNDIEITIESTAGRLSVQPKIQVINLKKESVAAAGPSSSSSSLILTGINVGIPKGTIVGIVGPSGSGKSTFLRALNRLWEPPAGTVFVDGYDVCSLDVVSLRRKVGMLFQVPALFEGTVGDNVRFGPKLRDKKRVLSNHEVCKLLSLADLDASMIDRNCNELSVGQAQRVALARTLANQPEVLLLDEPTSALDPISTQNIEDALLKLKRKQGMTIVMVSHSIKQVQRIADTVCLMVDGSIVEVLIPHQLSQAKHPMALKFLHLSS